MNDDYFVELEKIIEVAKSKKFKICAWGAGYVGRNQGYKMLTELGINIDFYCDNNSELYGKEVIDNLICINPKDIPQDTICFITASLQVSPDIKRQLAEYNLKYIVTYMQLCEYKSRNYFECQNRHQIAIYTCILGGYDDIQEPDEVIENCDYYLISDTEKKNSVYKYININDIKECRGLDNTRKNRYCKINAHKIFPNYRYSIYFDGCVVLNAKILKYIADLPITKITAMYRASHNSIYAEALKGIQNKRDAEELFIKQIEKYWNEGMPDDFGIIGPGIMIRQHNYPVCRKLMDDWWMEVLNFSRRDMVSFPYVLWKNGFSISDVNVCSKEADLLDGEAWRFIRNHKKPRTEI